jgi:hypothetical protein
MIFKHLPLDGSLAFVFEPLEFNPLWRTKNAVRKDTWPHGVFYYILPTCQACCFRAVQPESKASQNRRQHAVSQQNVTYRICEVKEGGGTVLATPWGSIIIRWDCMFQRIHGDIKFPSVVE